MDHSLLKFKNLEDILNATGGRCLCFEAPRRSLRISDCATGIHELA